MGWNLLFVCLCEQHLPRDLFLFSGAELPRLLMTNIICFLAGKGNGGAESGVKPKGGTLRKEDNGLSFCGVVSGNQKENLLFVVCVSLRVPIFRWFKENQNTHRCAISGCCRACRAPDI